MLPLTTAKNTKKSNFASPKRCFYSDAKWQIFQKSLNLAKIFGLDRFFCLNWCLKSA